MPRHTLGVESGTHLQPERLGPNAINSKASAAELGHPLDIVVENSTLGIAEAV
jgi:hypothetical protein